MESPSEQPVLYLLPSLLDAEFGLDHMGEKVGKVLGEICYLVVESERESRRMIRRILPGVDLQRYQTMVLNEHHADPDYAVYLEPMVQGHSMGLLSDAGCPVLADPGSGLVLEVHRRGWKVEPVSGPSSLLLAWMGSGLNGQRMEFHGYLAVQPSERMRDLRDLEQRSQRTRQTQVWIETPYRNQALVETALRSLKPSTLFCIACELTGGPREWIKTRSIADWNAAWARGDFPNLHKKPCVFLLQSP
ncbi:MAG: SAM-dependent methyltransferase [Bacteroidota bacterium]